MIFSKILCRSIAFIIIFTVVFDSVILADMAPATEVVDFSYYIEGEAAADQVFIPDRLLYTSGVKWDTSQSLTAVQAEEAAAEAAAREAAIAAGEEVGQAKYASSSINGMSGSALQAASASLAACGVILDMEAFDSDVGNFVLNDLVEPSTWLDFAGFYLDEQGVINYDNSQYYGIVDGSKITGVASSTDKSSFYNFSVEALGRLASKLHDAFNSGVADGSFKLNDVILRDGSTVASNITGSEFYSFVNQMSAVDYSSYSSFPSFISSGLKNSTDMYIINCTSYSNGWYNVYDYVPSTYFLFGDYSAFYQDLNSSEVSRSTVNGVNYDYFLLKDSFSYNFDSSRSYNLFGHFQIPSNGNIMTSNHNIHGISSVYHFRISDNTSLAKDKKGEVTIGDTTVHYNPDPDKNALENPHYVKDLVEFLEKNGYNIPANDNHSQEVGVEVDNDTGGMKIVDQSTLYPDEATDPAQSESDPAVSGFDTSDIFGLLKSFFIGFFDRLASTITNVLKNLFVMRNGYIQGKLTSLIETYTSESAELRVKLINPFYIGEKEIPDIVLNGRVYVNNQFIRSNIGIIREILQSFVCLLLIASVVKGFFNSFGNIFNSAYAPDAGASSKGGHKK